jgi:prophage regulatory protein
VKSVERRSHLVAPRLLRRERAAAYLDVSITQFDKMVQSGALPRPKRLSDGIKAWDVRDLDAHVDALQYDGAAPEDTWDD